MTLTNRLTLFFMTALAVVLTAFSVTLYMLARTHLHEQLDARVSTTMDTLLALAEIEPDGWDWEPELRRLPSHWEGDPPVWVVFDEHRNRIGGSQAEEDRLADFAAPDTSTLRILHYSNWNGHKWRVASQTLLFSTPETFRSRPDRKRYRTLVFVTALPVAPVQDTLAALAWSLTGVSAAIWLICCLVARWVCRRALAPVVRMTDSAKHITAADLGMRLPVPASSDELHDLAWSFNDLLARLQDSFERQRRFTGEASHQLRTPLTAILGQLEVALRRERSADEYRRALTSAVIQAGRLREIVEKLLFLARADADARLPDLEAVDLCVWLPEHLSAAWAGHTRFTDLRIDVQPRTHAVVLAHRLLLGTAVDNLIDNAFKYSPPGSPIRVGVEAGPTEPAITVEDQGPGVPENVQHRVFEPFFRLELARREGVPGVGLGLAITARIVAAFGGRIAMTSTLKSGSRFSILLRTSQNVV